MMTIDSKALGIKNARIAAKLFFELRQEERWIK
jgi:hypothetical protein